MSLSTLLPIILLAFSNGCVIDAAPIDGAADVIEFQPFSPQVVFQCGYRNRYLSKDGTGEWVTDNNPRAGCLPNKFDILKYCRMVYPDFEITNIVESSNYFELSKWCKLDGQQPCEWSFRVKPYRCLVGPFESEALLVPEHCHFGHVDDIHVCEDFDYWNRTAQTECGKRSSTPNVRSFAILEPCDLDMFSGVEFVCCPTEANKDSLEARTDLNVTVNLDKTQQQIDTDGDEHDEDQGSMESKKPPSSSTVAARPRETAGGKLTKNRQTTTASTIEATTSADECDEDESASD